jgi:hypothetical protein
MQHLAVRASLDAFSRLALTQKERAEEVVAMQYLDTHTQQLLAREHQDGLAAEMRRAGGEMRRRRRRMRLPATVLERLRRLRRRDGNRAPAYHS